MNDTQQIIEELSKAGIDPELEAKLKRLESRRITPETKIEQKRFLFRMFGKPCFPRGEIVAVTGKKKCGKTFFSSILMTLSQRRECMSMMRIEDKCLSVLWIDTEQSEESTQEILVERIMKMIGSPDDGQTDRVEDSDEYEQEPKNRFNIFNLRAENWNDRMPLIEMAVRSYKPDLGIFDGIRDVVNDINDGVMAQDVLERTMHLASELQCCICCILHQNKSLEDKTLRGALGTELGNKCFEEYECRKDADHKIFEVSQVSTRKYDIMDKLTFTVDDNGLPRLLSANEAGTMRNDVEIQTQSECERKFNPDYVHNGIIDSRSAFEHLLPAGTEMRATELRKAFMDLVGINSEKWYAWERTKALEEGIIVKRAVSANEVYYNLGNQQAELFGSPEADLPF